MGGMFKKTNIKLQLLTDAGMLLMFEAGIRCGISKATHKYATANKKYMKNYNKNIPSSCLQYLDANNLYEWAMCKKLPVGNFRWVKNLSLYTEESTKLITSLEKRGKYVVHISALEQALNHVLKLLKVHRVIEFRQEEGMKPYIDVNTEHRMNAKNEFEKDFLKLMNNSVFGKTMENVRNDRDIIETLS